MGLGPYDPSLRDIVVVQTGLVLTVVCVPVIWVGLIGYGLVSIIRKPSEARSIAKEIAQLCGVSIYGPFALTWDHICLLTTWTKQAIRGVNAAADETADDQDGEPLNNEIEPEDHWDPPTQPAPRRQLSSGSEISLLQSGPYHVPAAPKPYRYRSLKGANEIRLLNIYPGSFEDPLRGDVTTGNLSLLRSTAYDALSYTWADETGDAERSREILCVENGKIIHITKNCEAAIRRLRLPRKTRRVWIDAICINQDSNAERSHQVSLMSKIYTSARSVVVYTGEGTPQTDELFDWLAGLNPDDLIIPSRGEYNYLWDEIVTNLEWYWSAGRKRASALLPDLESGRGRIQVPESELAELVKDYFSRRWFRRVWVLQEVSLPDIRQTSVICGTRTTTASKALHAFSLLHNERSASMIRIFNLVRKKVDGIKHSRLLDLLIETRDRGAADPRDKIFGILSIANLLDAGRFPEMKADYKRTTSEVYTQYSTFFIQHHGPGLFLSLIKSPQRQAGLPSWAADWTVPWPNHNAVRGRDYAVGCRSAKAEDDGTVFHEEDGHHVLAIVRPMILQGFYTKNGHLDDFEGIQIENINSLAEDEVMVEMYPGLAALLRKDGDYYIFVQVCPHALSESGVVGLVEKWSSIVLDAQGSEEHLDGSFQYLSSPESFKIR